MATKRSRMSAIERREQLIGQVVVARDVRPRVGDSVPLGGRVAGKHPRTQPLQRRVDQLADARGELDLDRTSRLDWETLRQRVQTTGMRNSNTMAIAPTAVSSLPSLPSSSS